MSMCHFSIIWKIDTAHNLYEWNYLQYCNVIEKKSRKVIAKKLIYYRLYRLSNFVDSILDSFTIIHNSVC